MKIWVSRVFRGKNTKKKQRQSTLTQFVSFCSFHFIFFGGMFFVVRFCQNINHFQFSHECMPRDVLTVWLQSIEVKNWLPFEWVFTSHLYKNDRPMIKKNHEPHFISILGGWVHPTSFAKKNSGDFGESPGAFPMESQNSMVPVSTSYGYLDCLGRKKWTYITIIYYRLGSHKSCNPYTIQAIPWPDIVAAVLECTRPAIFQVWVRIWGPKKTLKPSGFGQVITTKRPGIKKHSTWLVTICGWPGLPCWEIAP